MAWFRRRGDVDPIPTEDPHDGSSPADDSPTVSAAVVAETQDSLARTARALEILAVQSNHVHGRLLALEARVDDLAASLVEHASAAPSDDVAGARSETRKVAAEVSRLEVNLAARLDAVNAELARLRGDHPDEIDLRDLTPADSGYPRSGWTNRRAS